MKIDCVISGSFQTNSYIVRKDDSTEDCVIIDTGLEPDTPSDLIEKKGFRPSAVILTHGHADHIGGISELRRLFPEIKVMIHREDCAMLTDADVNLSGMTGTEITAGKADIILADGDTI